MMGFGGALMGGITQGLTSALGTAASGVGQLIAQSHSRRQQNRAQAWMYHMDSTKYQRAVKDLRAAGINPILAATFGGGSPTSGVAGSSPGVSAQGGDVMSSARAGALMMEELKRIRQERSTSMALESKYWADAWKAQGERIFTDVATARESARLPYEQNMGEVWRELGPQMTGAAQAAKYLLPAAGVIGSYYFGRRLGRRFPKRPSGPGPSGFRRPKGKEHLWRVK